MTHVGCAAWLCLLIALPVLGALTGVRHGTGAVNGLAFGAAAWFALLTAYMCVLTILDWRKKKANPQLHDVPRWVIPTIWCAFAAASVLSVWLARRVW